MKRYAIFSFLFLALSAQAEQRTFEKTGPASATVKIVSDDPDAVQAAQFVDAAENNTFLEMMLKDKNSPLSEIRKKLELENCDEESSDGGWINQCGQVEITDSIQTYFGRGGWMSAGAAYTFFVGFRHDGTGRYFSSAYMVTITEDVEANTNEDMGYNGSLTKSLNLKDTVKLPTQDLRITNRKRTYRIKEIK